MSGQSNLSRNHVPVIDISPLLQADGHSSSNHMSDVVKHIDKALRDVGLFYISGHGVPQQAIDDLTKAASGFFELPLEKKMALSVRNSKAYRGYVQKGSEKTDGKVDVKEGIYFGPDVSYEDSGVSSDESDASSDDPDVRSDDPDVKSLVGPNQFPDEKDVPNFANVVKQYMDHMKTVGLCLMRGIAMGLKLNRDFFDAMFSDPSAWLALWSYPVSSSNDGSWGIWAHTDSEVITMIFQDDVGGLEVQFPDGEWTDVPHVPGTLVVNAGDSLEAWTKGLYRAAVHRVRSSPGKPRMSAPFFYGPSYESIIKPLDIDLTRDIDYSLELRRRKLPCSYGDYHIVSFQQSLDWSKA